MRIFEGKDFKVYYNTEPTTGATSQPNFVMSGIKLKPVSITFALDEVDTANLARWLFSDEDDYFNFNLKQNLPKVRMKE